MPEERFDDRSEPATPRRREEARERGHVARSQDLSAALGLLGAVLALYFVGDALFADLRSFTVLMLGHLAEADVSLDSVGALAWTGFLFCFQMMMPFLAAVFVVALAANYVQVGFLFTGEPLTPNWERLDPIAGLQRFFSMRALVRLATGLFKLGILTTVLYLTLSGEVNPLLHLMDVAPSQLSAYVAATAFVLCLRAALALVVLALLDFGFQRWQYEIDLRMTRAEVKEELKRLEGDPKIRERRRAIQRQLAMQRMMQKVPKATVVITNPTEVAVAIQYDQTDETQRAPKVVAKGMGYVAERIRNIAHEHEIPIVEKPWLARALYKGVAVDKEIPPDLYAAVAEVLAYVFRANQERMAFV
ncbi:MAG: flagellar biosynthesis protein FlhB [Planctomycetes bacterium]|nr:flagellar biosynthesis protein FlhB [Planctomycetota bacterium]